MPARRQLGWEGASDDDAAGADRGQQDLRRAQESTSRTINTLNGLMSVLVLSRDVAIPPPFAFDVLHPTTLYPLAAKILRSE
jgi:hypothetical protein